MVSFRAVRFFFLLLFSPSRRCSFRFIAQDGSMMSFVTFELFARGKVHDVDPQPTPTAHKFRPGGPS